MQKQRPSGRSRWSQIRKGSRILREVRRSYGWGSRFGTACVNILLLLLWIFSGFSQNSEQRRRISVILMGAFFSLGSVVCTISDPSSCGNWEPPGVDGEKYKFPLRLPETWILAEYVRISTGLDAVLLDPPSRAAAVSILFHFISGETAIVRFG